MKTLRFILIIWSAVLLSACEELEIPASPVMPSQLPEPEQKKDETEYIVLIGDIQQYHYDNNSPFWKTTIKWIDNRLDDGYAFDCILFTGDLTNNNSNWQWNRFHDIADSLSFRVPVISCIGNHDYEWSDNEQITDRYDTKFTKYVSFESTFPLIEARFEENRMENVVIRNTIHGRRFDILVLELDPREEVVTWAREWVSSHKDIHYILLTHEFLSSNGERIKDNECYGLLQLQYSGTSWTSPQGLWDNLVYDNDNILCVVCGHNGFSKQLYSENAAGRMVPQILFNLQYLENGGNGWIQIWEIPADSKEINVMTFHTVLGTYHEDPDASFSFPYLP